MGYENQYLTIVARSSGNVIKKAHSGTFYYSLDSGNTWTQGTNEGAIAVNAGDKVMFKGNLTPNTSSEPYGIGNFNLTTCDFDVEGNPMSLLFGDDFVGMDNFSGKTFCFASMFKGCTNLISAENLALVSLTATTDCYYAMFSGCTSLTTAMETLPAMTLASLCYNIMFAGCTSLVKAPKLPATEPVSGCYNKMFQGCSSLNEIWADLRTTSSTAYTQLWVDGVATDGTFHRKLDITTNWARATNGIPVGWDVADLNYFTVVAIDNCRIKASGSYFRSIDGGTWVLTASDTYVDLEAGEEMRMSTWSDPSNDYYITFNGSTGRFSVKGDIQSLNYRDNWCDDSPTKAYAFKRLFDGVSGLTSIDDLVLPTTSASTQSYCAAFRNTSITSIPDNFLPATTIGTSGYSYMFQYCTGLTDCSNVVLPDASMTSWSCGWMFAGCTGMTDSPKLMTVSSSGYGYGAMFSGCTSLSAITCMRTDIANHNDQWVVGVSPTGVFHKNPNAITQWGRSVSGIPTTWDVAENDDCFTVVAESTGTVKTNIGVTYASVNGGAWTNIGTNAISVNVGDEIRYEMTINPSDSSFAQFKGSTCQFHIKGDVQSLNYGVNYKNQTTTKNYAFKGLFSECTGLTRADELIMPSSSARTMSMRHMFSSCTNLQKAPELPATGVGASGYSYMFYGCTSLTTAPEIEAETVGDYSMHWMFGNCTSLTKAPRILPATTTTTACYQNMFEGCTSLTKSPILPAETVATYAYHRMFSGCTSLSQITCLAMSTGASNCTSSWVANVAPSGTFYKNKNKDNWTIGVNGIPTSWVIKDYPPSQIYLGDTLLEDIFLGDLKPTVYLGDNLVYG